jgi:serine/threonine protein kinase
LDDEFDLDEPALAEVADAILDGGAIDWEKVQSRSANDPKLASQLRALANVAALHRALFSADVRTGHEAGPHPTRPTWGHLQLLEKVGQGAFGEVFRAWDPHLSREVALKLLGSSTDSADDRSWVLQEARFLAAIRHPNVVVVHGADRIDGRVGFWTEFIRGQTLAELVHDQGRMGADEATAIGIEVCRAMTAVHRAGLLHRDIKANNVMREPTGRIVLLDFGTTKDFLEHTVSETAIGDPNGPTGTPLYVAPELWQESPATPQSDIYSLGVLLYFLATGSYPVQGATVGDVAQAHRAGDRVALADARPDLPARFVATVERAIAADPAARFGTIEELEAALTEVRRVPAPVGRAPVSRTLLAGVALLLILGVSLQHDALAPRLRPYLTWPRGAAPSQPAAQPSSVSAPEPIVAPPAAQQHEPVAPVESQQAVSEPAAELEKILTPPDVSSWSKPSLDGRSFAFIDRSGAVQVWDVAQNLVSAIKVPGPGEKAISVAISHQGDRVAFAWQYSDGSFEVQVVRRDGSNPILVLERRTAYEPHLRDWSHDGTELVCWLVQKDRQADLAILAINGEARQVLHTKPAGPTRASISPDGRFVVFGNQVGPGQIQALIVGRNGAPPRMLEPDGGVPEWMPSGSHLVVLRQSPTDEVTRDAWLVPMVNGFSAGAGLKVADDIVARVGVIPVFPTNDGKLLLLHQPHFNEIFSVAFDVVRGVPTAGPERLIRSRISGQASPSFSPDGKTVAFIEMRQRDVPGLNAVHSLGTVDASSGRVEHVPSKLYWQGAYRPAWLPDNLHVILFGRDADSRDRAGFYRVNVRTGEAKPLRLAADGEFVPAEVAALPSGTGFIYRDPRGFVRRTFEGEEVVLVASGGWTSLSRLALSVRDDRWAFGARRLDGRSVILVQDSGGEARELVVAAADEIVDVQCLTPNGSAVFFSRGSQQGGPQRIWIVNSDGTDAHEVGITIPGQPNPININPDGTRIVFPERRISQELRVRDISSALARLRR